MSPRRKKSRSKKNSEIRKRMLVNMREPEEQRVAIMDNGRLEEIYIERSGRPTLVGNIYRGRVVNIEPGIQAAFVDIGLPLKGFLHVSDVTQTGLELAKGDRPKTGKRRTIQSLLKKNMEILVQVTKDGIGKKGPALTCQISLPGRYLVVMPYLDKRGVSRKIEDEKERKRLKELLGTLDLPEKMGVIVRTAGQQKRKTDLAKDLKYLQRLWSAIETDMKKAQGPKVIYRDTELLVKCIRDFLTTDVQAVLVDTAEGTRKAREFCRVAMPRSAKIVRAYEGNEPIFQRYGVEHHLSRIFDRRVGLESGGSIVIDSTEAMVTVDVNSGRFTKGENTEETALKINLEAAKEIARQLRLRDLGGLIVTDFIDMRQEKNRKQVEKTFREALKGDRSRLNVLKMSRFCLIEITRQRLRPSLSFIHYDKCPHCEGTGRLLNSESLTARILRQVKYQLQRETVTRVAVKAHSDAAFYLLNERRSRLAALEGETGKRIEVTVRPGLPEEFEILPVSEGGPTSKPPQETQPSSPTEGGN